MTEEGIMTEVESVIQSILSGNSSADEINRLIDESWKRSVGIGAGAGAAIGAIAGYRKAKRKNQSRLKSVIKGVLTGAAIGGVAGATIPKGYSWLRKTRTATQMRRKLLIASRHKRQLIPPAAVASGLAGFAIYDFMQARGLSEDAKKVMEMIQKGTIVNSKQFAAKIDKNIKVCTNFAEIKNFLIRENEFPKWLVDSIAAELTDTIESGKNAMAYPGRSGEYVIVPPRCNAHIIAHEIGHILDFREKGITVYNSGVYQPGLLGHLIKSRYNKTVMAAEKNAWDKAPVTRDEEHEEIKKHALGTYDKSFHAGRGILVGGAAAFIAQALIFMIMELTSPRGRRQSRAMRRG